MMRFRLSLCSYITSEPHSATIRGCFRGTGAHCNRVDPIREARTVVCETLIFTFNYTYAGNYFVRSATVLGWRSYLGR